MILSNVSQYTDPTLKNMPPRVKGKMAASSIRLDITKENFLTFNNRINTSEPLDIFRYDTNFKHPK